ncbi:MAG: aminoglycoside phosphotransferase family protein, partial [Streptosporangiales bacterium]|nr:aminoglycoside phosphotransferase family protein [Streptosporangiales bacterium]
MDRESAINAFDQELHAEPGSPHVLNVVGVGGIGKSRLLLEMRNRSAETHRTVTLDLQVPAMRQQEDALAVMRVELGKQGVRFDRFDIAYAVLWQRLHPHLRLDRDDLPFVAESEALSQILDGAAGVPVFGTGVGLIRLMERATSSVRRRRQIKVDDTLRALDDLTNAELADAVTYLFAEDLRAASEQRGYALFVDAYEALAAGRFRPGRGPAPDIWLRDLIVQLDRGLVVVASRE